MVPFRMSARPLAAVLAVVTACGCDTLRARHRAGEGADYYKAEDYKNALYKYEQARDLDPSIDTVHLNLAFTYMRLFNQSPKSVEGNAYGGLAIREFEEYLKRKPGDADAHNYLVQTFVDTRRYDDAVAYFKPEIERNPPSIEAISTLGQIASKTNRIDDAIKWYEKRVEVNPQDPDGPYSLGVLLWDHLHNHGDVVGERRIALADHGIAALRHSIEMRPHDQNGWTYVNLLYRERAPGQWDAGARAVDLAEADKYLHIALDIKAGKAPPALPPPPTYPPPGTTPDGGAPPEAHK